MKLFKEINENKYLHNLEVLEKETSKKIIPVVKSNAYGHGIEKICTALKDRTELIAVVSLEEALEIINLKFTFSILILNSLNKDEMESIIHYDNIVLTINSLVDLENLLPLLHKKQKVHFQIDTGMNRQGFKDFNAFKEAIDVSKENKNIIIEGIYTHFTDEASREKQTQLFSNYLSYYPFPIIHTGSRCDYKKISVGNYIRVGLDLYGDGSKNNISQTATVYCYPLEIRTLEKDEKIGYNGRFQCQKKERIAVLPIGYSNGLSRSLSGFKILANNKLYEIVGNVCMNHIFVLVDESVSLNTKFIITSDELPFIEIAKYSNTISYEIMCMLLNNIAK